MLGIAGHPNPQPLLSIPYPFENSPGASTKGANDRRHPMLSWPTGSPIHLVGVTVRRGPSEILRGLDLTFEPGRRTLLLGPSGSGKTTLLRLLNRLEDPVDGEIRVADRRLDRFPVAVVRRQIGLVFQGPRPLPGTVAENLAYPFTVRNRELPRVDQMSGWLDEVGLAVPLDRQAGGLSGGERQRLALATALAADPEILLLDEPTSALDPIAASRVAEVLRRRSERTGLRTIVVSHDRRQAASLGDWAVVLRAGRIDDEGPIDEVLARHDAAEWAVDPAEPGR